MLKRIVIFSSILFFSFIGNLEAQIASYVKEKVRIEAKRVITQWETCHFKGNVRISDKNEYTANGKDYIVVEGTVDYYSDNCGSVTARYNAKFKIIWDELECIRICVNMPYCLMEDVILNYDKECKYYD